MPDFPKETIQEILKENGAKVDEEAVELLARRLEDYVRETGNLASEAAKLDDRRQIKREDIRSILKFNTLLKRK